jgi:hypothetical protein
MRSWEASDKREEIRRPDRNDAQIKGLAKIPHVMCDNTAGLGGVRVIGRERQGDDGAAVIGVACGHAPAALIGDRPRRSREAVVATGRLVAAPAQTRRAVCRHDRPR